MYQIVGIKSDGTSVDLFTWSGSVAAGIRRAYDDELTFGHGYRSFTYRTLDPS